MERPAGLTRLQKRTRERTLVDAALYLGLVISSLNIAGEPKLASYATSILKTVRETK